VAGGEAGDWLGDWFKIFGSAVEGVFETCSSDALKQTLCRLENGDGFSCVAKGLVRRGEYSAVTEVFVCRPGSWGSLLDGIPAALARAVSDEDEVRVKGLTGMLANYASDDRVKQRGDWSDLFMLFVDGFELEPGA
jgi:hypothetical protein